MGELGKTLTGNTPSTEHKKNWENKSSGYLWITPSDICGFETKESKYRLSRIGKNSSRIVSSYSLLVTSIASIGKNTINLVPTSFNQQINAIEPYKNDVYFLYYAMENNIKSFKMIAGKTATPIINKSQFDSFDIKVTDLVEQTKIGEFFKNLDDLIAVNQRK